MASSFFVQNVQRSNIGYSSNSLDNLLVVNCTHPMKISIITISPPKEEYGIYGNCISEKGDPQIMEKSQKSIADRFGFPTDPKEDSDY